mgnify:CR=1 FL=1
MMAPHVFGTFALHINPPTPWVLNPLQHPPTSRLLNPQQHHPQHQPRVHLDQHQALASALKIQGKQKVRACAFHPMAECSSSARAAGQSCNGTPSAANCILLLRLKGDARAHSQSLLTGVSLYRVVGTTVSPFGPSDKDRKGDGGNTKKINKICILLSNWLASTPSFVYSPSTNRAQSCLMSSMCSSTYCRATSAMMANLPSSVSSNSQAKAGPIGLMR